MEFKQIINLKDTKMFTGDLKVVNDIGERGGKLIKEFKVTGAEEQRKMFLHCVENTKNALP